MSPPLIKRCPASGEKHCPHCDCTFNVRGYVRHEQACHRTHQEELAPTIDTGGGTFPEPYENGTLYTCLSCEQHDSDSRATDELIQIAEIAEDLDTEVCQGHSHPKLLELKTQGHRVHNSSALSCSQWFPSQGLFPSGYLSTNSY